MLTQRLLHITLFVSVAIVGVLAYLLMDSEGRSRGEAGGSDGILGGEFTLHSQTGAVTLSDFRGEVVILYFGFLNCPEVCPASMSTVSNALKKLDQPELDQVQSILVSIDPARDTLAELAEFSEYFHPNILGVTGSQDEIDAVTADYGAFIDVVDSTTPGSDYEFRHSSRYYVIDQSGNLVDAMRHSTTPNELAARIRTLI